MPKSLTPINPSLDKSDKARVRAGVSLLANLISKMLSSVWRFNLPNFAVRLSDNSSPCLIIAAMVALSIFLDLDLDFDFPAPP